MMYLRSKIFLMQSSNLPYKDASVLKQEHFIPHIVRRITSRNCKIYNKLLLLYIILIFNNYALYNF